LDDSTSVRPLAAARNPLRDWGLNGIYWNGIIGREIVLIACNTLDRPVGRWCFANLSNSMISSSKREGRSKALPRLSPTWGLQPQPAAICSGLANGGVERGVAIGHERSPWKTTHNDLRFAVDALPGGRYRRGVIPRSLTIYAAKVQTVRLGVGRLVGDVEKWPSTTSHVGGFGRSSRTWRKTERRRNRERTANGGVARERCRQQSAVKTLRGNGLAPH